MDEARALIATDEAARRPAADGTADGGPDRLGRLILPDTTAEGGRFVAEIALSVIGLPVAVGTMFLLVLARRSRFRARPGGAAVAGLAVAGAAAIAYALRAAGLSLVTALAVAIGSMAGLAVRAWLRWQAETARSRALDRLDRPVPAATLPVARAVAAEAVAPRPAPPRPAARAPARQEVAREQPRQEVTREEPRQQVAREEPAVQPPGQAPRILR